MAYFRFLLLGLFGVPENESAVTTREVKLEQRGNVLLAEMCNVQ